MFVLCRQVHLPLDPVFILHESYHQFFIISHPCVCHCTLDASLTPHNILTATSTAVLGGLCNCLGVRVSVYDQIMANSSYSTEEERREALIVYFLNTIPLASWATLARELYKREERHSLEAVRKYLHHTTGQ